jgi:uncharacterized protein YdaU (DUF1376 family)
MNLTKEIQMKFANVETRPAVMLYAERMMADRRYRFMSLEERGLFFSMFCECWKNGSVPADLHQLSIYLGIDSDKVKKAASENCLSFFERQGDELICPQVEMYRAEMIKKSERKQQAGSKGGLAAAASRRSFPPSNA